MVLVVPVCNSEEALGAVDAAVAAVAVAVEGHNLGYTSRTCLGRR